jgi:hypothetical protein
MKWEPKAICKNCGDTRKEHSGDDSMDCLIRFEALPEPPELVIPTGCNRHSNCKDAEAEYAKLHGRHPGFNFHCHDDTCEDCFGQ